MELQKFDINSITANNACPLVIIVGRRNTGKTVLVRDILYHNQDFPHGTIISNTGEEADGMYSKLMNTECIHDKYNPEIIDQVVIRQQESEFNDQRTMLILDDCIFDNEWWDRNTVMNKVLTDKRELKIMSIVTLQYPLGLPPLLRSKIDYTFIFRNIPDRCKQITYNNYASIIPTYELFCQLLDRYTDSFSCLVIHNTQEEWTNKIFWHKAPIHEEFRMFEPEYQYVLK